jgi:hypothetical protein
VSRQSGSEVALYRNLSTNERFVAVGTRTGVEVPQGSRLIAHTQPGTGACPCALALITIASIEEAVGTGTVDRLMIERAKLTIRGDADVHAAMNYYWIEQGRASDEQTIRQILLD